MSLQIQTLILSPASLAQSPHLSTLVEFINDTYKHYLVNAGNGRLLPPESTLRLRSPAQLCSELAPDGFTILMFSPDISHNEADDGSMTGFEDEATLIASASAKPYAATQREGPDSGDQEDSPFKQPYPDHADGEAWPKWEGLAMAVHPLVQRHGLSERLVTRVIAEIKRRAFSSVSDPGSDAKRKLIIVISVFGGHESLFSKQGFVTTTVQTFGPGTMGSKDGFSVAKMERVVEWDEDPDTCKFPRSTNYKVKL